MPFVEENLTNKINQMKKDDPDFEKAFDSAELKRKLIKIISNLAIER